MRSRQRRRRSRSAGGVAGGRPERRGGRPEGSEPPEPDTPEQPIDYLDAIVPSDEAPEPVPGAILKTLLDTDHWLAAGTDGELGVFVESDLVDPRYFSAANIKNRLESYFQMIEQKRAGAR